MKVQDIIKMLQKHHQPEEELIWDYMDKSQFVDLTDEQYIKLVDWTDEVESIFDEYYIHGEVEDIQNEKG
jgi:malonyl CoA-acyl carrier protein transacylase